MIDIRDAMIGPASWVTANMQPADRAEVYAQLPDDLPTKVLADYLIGAPGSQAFTAWIGNEPVALFGSAMMTVNCMSLWAVGTPRMRRAVPAITQFYVEHHAPRRIDDGVNVAEARSIVGHHEAHRWIESLGGVQHGEPFPYGKAGEEFVLYRWTVAGYRAICARRTRV